MQTRKIPLRKCVGCQQMIEKRQLVRVVRNKDGEMSVDLTGKKAGRGAYICASMECLKTAIKRKGLERSLKVAIPAEVYDSLEQEMSKIAK